MLVRENSEAGRKQSDPNQSDSAKYSPSPHPSRACLHCNTLREILGGLCLASASGSLRGASQVEVQRAHQRAVAAAQIMQSKECGTLSQVFYLQFT